MGQSARSSCDRVRATFGHRRCRATSASLGFLSGEDMSRVLRPRTRFSSGGYRHHRPPAGCRAPWTLPRGRAAAISAATGPSPVVGSPILPILGEETAPEARRATGRASLCAPVPPAPTRPSRGLHCSLGTPRPGLFARSSPGAPLRSGSRKTRCNHSSSARSTARSHRWIFRP